MAPKYHVQTDLTLDRELVGRLREAYDSLGCAGLAYTDEQFLSALAHDLLHGAATLTKDVAMPPLVVATSVQPPRIITGAQLAEVNDLEAKWHNVGVAVQNELLRRIGATPDVRQAGWFLPLPGARDQEVRIG